MNEALREAIEDAIRDNIGCYYEAFGMGDVELAVDAIVALFEKERKNDSA